MTDIVALIKSRLNDGFRISDGNALAAVEEIARLRKDLADGSFYKESDIDALVSRAETAEAEIVRLRGLLRRWQQGGCPDCQGDCASANPPVLCCIVAETTKALSSTVGNDGGQRRWQQGPLTTAIAALRDKEA